MGPNNPNQQLEDTSDISSTVDGREVTSGSLTWQNGTLGTQQLVMNIKPYTTWEVEKSFVLELYRVSGSPVGVGDGEVDTAHGSVIIKVSFNECQKCEHSLTSLLLIFMHFNLKVNVVLTLFRNKCLLYLEVLFALLDFYYNMVSSSRHLSLCICLCHLSPPPLSPCLFPL